MAISIPAAARADYCLAKSYLCRDPGERRIFARAEHSRRVIHLTINHRSDDRFDPNTDTIAWDPEVLCARREAERNRRRSVLAHELDHAVESPGREDALNNARAPVRHSRRTPRHPRLRTRSRAHAGRSRPIRSSRHAVSRRHARFALAADGYSARCRQMDEKNKRELIGHPSDYGSRTLGGHRRRGAAR